MSVFHPDDTRKLEKPTYTIITFEVDDDENLLADDKLLFGYLSVLSTKHGYCWATNEQLADMCKVSLSTIIRRLKRLEKFGHIKRQIFKKYYFNDRGVKRYAHRRIIYTRIEAFKKSLHKVTDDSVCPRSDKVTDDPSINNKRKENNNRKSKSKKSDSKKEDVVVSHKREKMECLEHFSFDAHTVKTILTHGKDMSLDDFKYHLRAAQESIDKYRRSHDDCEPAAIVTASIRDKWKPNNNNQEKNRKLLETLRSQGYDGKEYGTIKFSVRQEGVAIDSGGTYQSSNVNDKDFFSKVKDWICKMFGESSWNAILSLL